MDHELSMWGRLSTGFRVDWAISMVFGFSSDRTTLVHILFDVDANSRFLAAYIDNRDAGPNSPLGEIRNRDRLVADALELLDAAPRILADIDDTLRHREETKLRRLGDHYAHDLTALPFTGRFFLYSDEILTAQERDAIGLHAQTLGLGVVIRDKVYLGELERWERPTLFISHDSRDKESIAKPLANALQKNHRLSAWLDDYTLRIGDSLRDSIERGLKECQGCVLVLTPNFLANPGWTKKEFDSIFTRELVERGVFMFPIWSGVTVRDVYQYSPSLADRKGVTWEQGVDKVAWEIYRALPKHITGSMP